MSEAKFRRRLSNLLATMWASARLATRAGPHRRAVARGAAASRRLEQLLGGGIVDEAEQRPVGLEQGHADGELGDAIGEGAGAVDRVDHPDAAAAEPRTVVLGLLRQPAVAARRTGRP